MISILYFDPRDGKEHSVSVDGVHLWEAIGGGREHPDGTVIEGYLNGSGVLQLDVTDRRGRVHIREEPFECKDCGHTGKDCHGDFVDRRGRDL